MFSWDELGEEEEEKGICAGFSSKGKQWFRGFVISRNHTIGCNGAIRLAKTPAMESHSETPKHSHEPQ